MPLNRDYCAFSHRLCNVLIGIINISYPVYSKVIVIIIRRRIGVVVVLFLVCFFPSFCCDVRDSVSSSSPRSSKSAASSSLPSSPSTKSSSSFAFLLKKTATSTQRAAAGARAPPPPLCASTNAIVVISKRWASRQDRPLDDAASFVNRGLNSLQSSSEIADHLAKIMGSRSKTAFSAYDFRTVRLQTSTTLQPQLRLQRHHLGFIVSDFRLLQSASALLLQLFCFVVVSASTSSRLRLLQIDLVRSGSTPMTSPARGSRPAARPGAASAAPKGAAVFTGAGQRPPQQQRQRPAGRVRHAAGISVNVASSCPSPPL